MELHIRHISKTYPNGVQALKDVSLTIPLGMYGLLGPNGAGKFEAVVGTGVDQVAVAPGELRRTWSEEGRQYFHYVSDVPLNGEEVFFSADYEVHRDRWKDVDIQVFVHPGHAEHVGRVLRSARASLDYYSAQFGPYPHSFLHIVEQPGNFLGMSVDGSGVVTGGEGFFLLDPQRDGFDVISEVVAHEMGHQWGVCRSRLPWPKEAALSPRVWPGTPRCSSRRR